MISFKNNIITEISDKLVYQAGEASEKFYASVDSVGKLAQIQAYEVAALDPQSYEKLLEAAKIYVEKNELACGSGIWLEPYVYDEKTKYFGPYMYKDNDKVELTWDYSNADYDYFQYEWYKIGMNAKGDIAWTQPYLDEVTNTVMITSSSPIRVGDKIIGVTTADIGLNYLRDYVKNIKVGNTGFAFVVTSDGYYLASKDSAKDLKQKITEDKQTDVRAAGQKIVAAKDKGVQQLKFEGQDCFLAFAPIGDTGMKLVEVLPQVEAFASLNNTIRVNTVIVILAILAFVALLALMLQQLVIKPLRIVMADAEKVAGGDLSGYNETSDTDDKRIRNELALLKNSFDTMVKNLRGLIIKIKDAASSLANTSDLIAVSSKESAKAIEQIAVTTNELAGGAAKQAELAQDGDKTVSATIERLNNVLGNLHLLEESDNKVEESIEEGIDRIIYQKQKMAESKERTLNLENTISELRDKSQQIDQILMVIQDVAKHTNLLALNAAIEAARAGEQGKGFAVVAGQIRKLAETANDSSNEIKGIVEQIRGNIDNAVVEMEQATATVIEQENAVEATSRAFDDIRTVIQEALNKTKDVAHSATMLSEDAKNLKQKIDQIADISQDNAAAIEEVSAATEEQSATSEEISAAADELAELASQLREQTNIFKY
jgi:methyl-accepting chemotaxis protein